MKAKQTTKPLTSRQARKRAMRSIGARGLVLFASVSAIAWGATTLCVDAIGEAKASEFVNSSETIEYVSEEFDPEIIGEQTVSEEVVSEDVVEEEIEVTVDEDGNLWDQNGNRIDEEGNILDADGNIVENETENVIEQEEYREMEAPELTQTHLHVRTKYTFVDGTVPLGDGRTVYDLTSIDEFFASSDDVLKAYNAQLDGLATLYDGASENYYVMLVNPGFQNGMKAKVIGVDFAQNNDNAEMIDGAIYDPETGLAYIPKDTQQSENAMDEDGIFIQAQVMLAIDGYKLPESTLRVESMSVKPGVRAVGETTVKGGDWLDTVDIPVVNPEDAGKVSLSDLSAYVDGIADPLNLEDGNTASYDPETGVLSLSADAQTIPGIKVVIGGTLLDGLTPVANAAALTPSSMKKYPYGELTASAAKALAKKEGDVQTYTGWWCHYWNPSSGSEYHVKNKSTGKQDFPWTWDHQTSLYYWGPNIDNSKNPVSSNWSTLKNELKKSYGYWFMFELPIKTKLKGITGANGKTTMNLTSYYNHSRTFAKKIQAMAPATCNHIRLSALPRSGPVQDQGQIDMKVLKADMSSSKRSIVVAFHARTGCYQNDPFGPVVQEATAVYAFKVASQPARVQVRKVNAATGKNIPKAGFTFAIREKGSTKNLATVKTGADGTGEFNKDLEPGTYHVYETAVPAGFPSPSSQYATVTIKENGSGGTKRSSDNKYVYTVAYKDYPCAYLNIVKKNASGSTIPMAGFKFTVSGTTVHGTTKTNFTQTVTTNAQGTASFDVPILVPSTVTVKESAAASPFVADTATHTIKLATVDDVGNAKFSYDGASAVACASRNGVKNLASISLKNKQHAHIEVVKINARSKQPAAIEHGFKFTLYDSNNAAIESKWTDADGIARFTTSCSVPGTYKVKETEVDATKAPFYLNSVVHTVTLTASGTKGAVSGGIVDTKVHSADGSVANVVKVSDNLMANDPWAMVKIRKLSKQGQASGAASAVVKKAGFKFHLTGTGFNGAKIDETVTTDADGIAKFKSKLLVGNTYTIEETTAIEPYTRTLKKIQIKPVTINNVGDIKDGLKGYLGIADSSMTGCDKKNVLAVNFDDSSAYWDFANDQYAFIEVQKINKATGNPLRKAGFTFTLSGLDLDGKAFKDSADTDEDGIARFKRRIRVGSEYEVQESAVIEPFVLNPTVIKATPVASGTGGAVVGGIADDRIGDTATQGVKNVLLVNDERNANEQYGYIRVIKRNIETGKTIPLSDVMFDVFSGDEKLASVVTGADGTAIVPSDNGQPYRFPVPGTYTLKETSVPMPYNKLTQPIEVSFVPDGDFGDLKQGHTQSGLTQIKCVVDAVFQDAPQYGRVTITKTDSENGKKLKGASYKIIALHDINYVGQGDESRDPGKSCGYPVAKTTEIKSGSSEFNRDNGEVTITNPITFVNADKSEFDTITTGDDGTATSGWLPIDESGRSSYALVEVHSANGRLIDGTPIPFDLIYNKDLTDTQCISVNASQTDEPNDFIIHKALLADGSALSNVTIGLWQTSNDVQTILSEAANAPKDTDTYVLRTPDDTIVPKAYRLIRGIAVDATGVVSETRSVKLSLASEDGSNSTQTITLNQESAIATNLTPGKYVATLVDENGTPVGGAAGVAEFKADEADEVTIVLGATDGKGTSEEKADEDEEAPESPSETPARTDAMTLNTVVAPAGRRSASFQWRSDLSAWVATDLAPASTYQVEINRKPVKRIDTSTEGGSYWFGRYANTVGEWFQAGYLDQAALPISDANIIHEGTFHDGTYQYESKTDGDGNIIIKRIGTGTYVVAEILPPVDETGHRSFLVDRAFHVIDIDGDTGYIKILNKTDDAGNQTDTYERSKVLGFKDDTTKLDISKKMLTDGEEIEGAELVLTDVNTYDEIDRWISTKEPHRISGLIPGRYRLTEHLTPKDYDKAESIEFTVFPTGVSQHHIMLDSPISINAEIDKRQEIANPLDERDDPNDEENNAKAQENLVGDYEYSVDFRSNSNTWTDEFTVEDPLQPANDGLAHLVSLTTPQAWQDFDGKMNVWYRTNKTPVDYRDLQAEGTKEDGDDATGEKAPESHADGSESDGEAGNETPSEQETDSQTGTGGQGTVSGEATDDDESSQEDGTDAQQGDGQEGTENEEGDEETGDGSSSVTEQAPNNPRPWIRFAANATLSDGHENAWLYDDKAMSADKDGDCRIIDYAGWKLWKADLSATVSTTLNVSDLGLATDEYVTGVRFEYGRVEVGFTTRTEDWDRDLLKNLHDDLDNIDASNRGTFADHDDAMKAGITRLSTELGRFQTEVTKEYEETLKEADKQDAEADEALRKEIEEYNKALAEMEDAQGKLRRFIESPVPGAYDGDPETDESLAALNEATETTKLAIRAAMALPGVESGKMVEARKALIEAAESVYGDVNGTIDATCLVALREAIDAYADEVARIPEDEGAHDMDEATTRLTESLMATMDAVRSVALSGRVPYAPAVLAMRLTDKYITGTELHNSAKVDAYRNGGNDTVEELRTTLTNKEDGTHFISPTGTATVIDTVSYRGLTPGTKYVMKGVLHLRKNGSDAGPITVGGNQISASKEFTAETPSGSVDLEFTFDASLIDGGAAVAFERCEVVADGTLVGIHEDINDENQSVSPDENPDGPKIRTSLANKGDGTHEIAETGTATVVDTVSYRNLVPGTKYVMTGVIHVRKNHADTGILISNGAPVTASKEFTPNEPSGTVELEFAFDVKDLAGGRAVAFETCKIALTGETDGDKSEGATVATHEDINDEGQTVTPKGTPEEGPTELPVNRLEGHDEDEVMQRPKKHEYAIGTYLATVDGDKHIDIDGSEPVTLIDHVVYSGLVPGHEYEMAAELHINLNHADGGIIEGTKTTQRFTPTSSDGTVEVRITVPRGEMPLAPWVAFEELHKVIPETGSSSEYVLASHMDINDENQTVNTTEIAEDLIQLGGIVTSVAIASVAATVSLFLAISMARRKRDA